ncbi:response regulator [Pleionea sediminis]|uniref:response regulator n=1 Tax=Pleionea sediminis TaxID=2569479 RepID=UPI0011850CDA|nr:response regulator [Pleionea sediminis]
MLNANSKTNILIVEDEEKIARLLADYLNQDGFKTCQLYRGDQVIDTLSKSSFDLVLLDIMLPGLDGLQVCKRIRETSNIPIIMITARIEEIDRLLGLELGADDYICKPFSPREVVARVKAVLRRFNLESNTSDKTADHDNLTLDEQRFRVERNGAACELTKVEFFLIKTLLSNPGLIYSRNQLMDIIYDDGHSVSDRTIDSHIKKLRKKLLTLGFEENCIHSVYGVGYKYE